jgi:hypothetical protein
LYEIIEKLKSKFIEKIKCRKLLFPRRFMMAPNSIKNFYSISSFSLRFFSKANRWNEKFICHLVGKQAEKN